MNLLTTDLKAAARSLRRHAGTTALNVLGLTVALAACTLIALYVRYETSADAFHPNADRLYLQPFGDIYLGSADLRFTRGLRLGNRTYVYAFAVVGLLILVIACVNVTNLATAQALRRAREVGVRRALGAGRSQIARQFFGETGLLCLLSAGAALIAARAVLPAFRVLVDRPLQLSLTSDPVLATGLLAAVALTTVLAGAYPAVVLAGMRPSRALSGRDGRGSSRTHSRQGLVTLQFTAAIALVAITAVIYQQIRYVQTKDLGFVADQVVVLPIRDTDILQQYPAFKTELLRHPGVTRVTGSQMVPGEGTMSFEVHPEGKPEDENWQAQAIRVDDADYVETYGMKLLAGRSFSPDRPTDSTRAVLVNETLVQTVGWGSPEAAVGKRIDVEGEVDGGVVIGVLADFHTESLHQAIAPLVMWMAPRHSLVSVRIAGTGIEAALDHMRQTWNAFESAHPFNYFFVDESFARAYRAERRMMQLLGVFAGLALLVACLGLLGLAAFAAQRRQKEIGVRKVLGATVTSIVGLLSTDFLKLVAAAFVAAAPLAYLAVQRWLQDFAYRIEVGPGIFLAAGLAVAAVALATVSTQALRAARTDPARVLRQE